jgi:hypothetical protein
MDTTLNLNDMRRIWYLYSPLSISDTVVLPSCRAPTKHTPAARLLSADTRSEVALGAFAVPTDAHSHPTK